jgi:hypothetical protein
MVILNEIAITDENEPQRKRLQPFFRIGAPTELDPGA